MECCYCKDSIYYSSLFGEGSGANWFSRRKPKDIGEDFICVQLQESVIGGNSQIGKVHGSRMDRTRRCKAVLAGLLPQYVADSAQLGPEEVGVSHRFHLGAVGQELVSQVVPTPSQLHGAVDGVTGVGWKSGTSCIALHHTTARMTHVLQCTSMSSTFFPLRHLATNPSPSWVAFSFAPAVPATTARWRKRDCRLRSFQSCSILSQLREG